LIEDRRHLFHLQPYLESPASRSVYQLRRRLRFELEIQYLSSKHSLGAARLREADSQKGMTDKKSKGKADPSLRSG